MKKKSVINKKKFSVLVCAILVMSIFAAIPASMAWDIPVVDTENQHSHDMVEILAMVPGSDTDPFYVGEEDIEFAVRIRNHNDPGLANPTLERVMYTITGVDGPSTTAISWTVDTDEGPTGTGYIVGGGATSDSANFQFDVADNNGDAVPGVYNITFRINYEYDEDDDGAGADTAANELEYLEFEIANNADVADVEATASDNLWAGEMFQEFIVNVANDGGELLDDASLTLSGLPSGVTLRDSTARIPAGIPIGGNDDFYYRVDVDSDVAPGIYPIDYTFTATRDGVDVTEDGEIDLVVDFTPKIEASIDEEILIEQGTIKETITVNFQNVGNVPLNEVYIGMIPDVDYFPVNVEHYEYGDEVYPMPVYVGNLGVGDTLDEPLEFDTGFHRFLQEGTHMIQFRWDGWYYDDGSTDESTRYYHVGVDWTDGTPDEGILYDVVEDNHMYDPGAGDTEIASPWIAPHIFIEVVDEVIDMEGFVDDSVELLGDITYVELEVTLQNFEMVPFRDMEVVLNVGEGTPFLNPQDRTLDTVAMHRGDSDDTIDAYTPGNPGEADIVFYVSVNSEYVTDTLHGLNHAYLGSMVITSMINENTLEEVTDQTIPLSGEVRGFGPRVVVEGEFSDNRVVAGEVFNLNYTIANHGDDIARDTWVMMQPNPYDNEEWAIHRGFVSAIASDSIVEEPGVTKWNKSTEFSDITLETLGIDSAKEIVELHMYVEGALSSPQPYIGVLYIGELAPGDEITVTFEMVSDRDMQMGKPYQETIFIQYTDTDGVTSEWEEHPLTIRTRATGESYEPEAGILGTGADGATMMMLLLVIILVIVVAIFVMSRKSGKHKAEKVPEATEPEFEPEPAPEPYEEPFEEPFEEEPFEEEEEWEVESDEPEFEEEVIEEPEEEEEVW